MWSLSCHDNLTIGSPLSVNGEQRAVLSHEEQAMLLECTTKSEVVAFLTQHLERVLCSHDDDLVLVNSENCTWSEDFHTWYPHNDLFVCHKGQYKQEQSLHSNTTSKFGVLSDWCVLDSLAVGLIAHVQIDQAACWGTAKKLINGELPYGKVIIFDRSEFWLIESEDQQQASTVKMKWSEEGSEKALTKFARVPVEWIEMLKAACTKMEVNVLEGGYLRGTEYCRTFRVHRANDTDKELALKMIMGAYTWLLRREYERMQEAVAEYSSLVMGVEAFEEVSFSVGDEARKGGALLLSQVGKRIERSSSIEVYTNVLQSLFAMHQRGVIHGNPLWDNVVEVDDGSFRWINFGLCPLVVGDRQELAKTIPEFESLSNAMKKKIAISQHELKALTASMLQRKYSPPPVLEKKIATYTGTDDPRQEECCNAIIASLVEHVMKGREMGYLE
jgi:hypothetical protein